MRRVVAVAGLLLASIFLTAGAPTAMSGRMITHGFPFRTASSVPPCTAADSCVMDCYATASAWECKKPDGTAVAVTQGVGTTFVQTPWGYAAQIDADAEAPTITSANMEATLPGGSGAFYDGAYSVFILANPGATVPSSVQGAFGHYGATAGYNLYSDTANVYGRHVSGSSVMAQGIVSSAPARWQATVGAVTAGGVNTTRAAGAEASATAATPCTPIAQTAYFGRLDPASGAGTNLGGFLARVRFYSKALSAAERATLERQAFGGVGSGGRELTTSRASTAWMEHPDGFVYAYASNMPRIHPTYGLLIEETRTNLLAYSADFSNAAWTKAGSAVAAPVVTVNQATAPDGTLTADRVDFAATTLTTDYSIIVPPAPALGTYSGSVYARTVSGTGTLYVWQKRGVLGSTAVSTACALTTTWTRCYSDNVTHTDVTAQFGIGPFPATADQPASQPALSVYLWGGQLEAGVFSTSPIATGASAVQRLTDSFTAPLTGAVENSVAFNYVVRWPRPNTAGNTTCTNNTFFDATGVGNTPPGLFGAWLSAGTVFTCDGRRSNFSNLSVGTPAGSMDYAVSCARRDDRVYTRVNGVAATPGSVATTRGDKLQTAMRIGTYSTSAICAINGYMRDLQVTR